MTCGNNSWRWFLSYAAKLYRRSTTSVKEKVVAVFGIQKAPTIFGSPFAFSSTIEGVWSAQVQAQNKHSRA
jgi:hypothetical protein